VEFDFDFRRGRRHGHCWHLDSKLNSGGDTTAVELVLERSESAGFGFDQRNNRWMWLTSSSKIGIERLRYWMAPTSSESRTSAVLKSIRLVREISSLSGKAVANPALGLWDIRSPTCHHDKKIGQYY
jgi:hypothetical protein